MHTVDQSADQPDDVTTFETIQSSFDTTKTVRDKMMAFHEQVLAQINKTVAKVTSTTIIMYES